MERHLQNNQRRLQQQGARRPLPAISTTRDLTPYTPPTTGEKVKYTAAASALSGIGAGLLGMHSVSALVALTGGVIAWNCSDAIRARLQGRYARVRWIRPTWLTWKWWTTAHNPRQPLQGSMPEAAEAVDPNIAREAEEMNARYFDQPEPEPQEDYLRLGRRLRPGVDTFLSKRVVVLGVSGWGKSNTVAVILEELGKYRVPFLCCDTEGEYAPICTREWLYRPFLADSSNTSIDGAYDFGRHILDEGLQVILNLDSFKNDNEGAAIMIEIIRGMREWEEDLPNDQRVACAVILDEAQVWLPENEAESAVSRVKDSSTKLSLLDALQQTFFNVVRRGRKRGIGFIFATQKLADIDKRCLQTDWGIYGRQEDPVSLKRYNELGIDKDIAMKLKDGEAWVKNAGLHLDAAYQIRKRRSPHGAKSPGLANVRARYRTANLPPQQPLQGENMRGPITGPLTASKQPIRPDLERPEGQSYARNITPSEQPELSSEGLPNITRNVRNVVPEPAPEAAVSAQMEPLRPLDWDDKKIELLSGFYRVFNSLDKCLQALDLSTSQRNRDFARDMLKKQGLWKDK